MGAEGLEAILPVGISWKGELYDILPLLQLPHFMVEKADLKILRFLFFFFFLIMPGVSASTAAASSVGDVTTPLLS